MTSSLWAEIDDIHYVFIGFCAENIGLKPFAILATTANVAFTQQKKTQTYKFNARILFKMSLVSIFVLYSHISCSFLINPFLVPFSLIHLRDFLFFPYLFNFFSENSLCKAWIKVLCNDPIDIYLYQNVI